MDIFGGIASVLSGGLTGIIGSIGQGILELKSKKLDLELAKEKLASELALKKADAEIALQQAASAIGIQDSKGFEASQTNEAKTFHEGIVTEKQNWLLVILDFLRGIVRPFLTLYLCVLTTLIYIQARRLLNDTFLSPEQALDLVTQIIFTILYITTTCISWWFGSRNSNKRISK